MKNLILLILWILFNTKLPAQSNCYLTIGGLKFYDSTKTENTTDTGYDKQTILKTLFGNIYSFCPGSENKVRSFSLSITADGNPGKFERHYPFNYILPNDTIVYLLNNSSHFMIILDSIRLYDGKIVPPVKFSSH